MMNLATRTNRRYRSLAIRVTLIVTAVCVPARPEVGQTAERPFLILDGNALTREAFLEGSAAPTGRAIPDDSEAMRHLLHRRIANFMRERVESELDIRLRDAEVQEWCDLQAKFFHITSRKLEHLTTLEIAKAEAYKRIQRGDSTRDEELEQLIELSIKLGVEPDGPSADRAEVLAVMERELADVEAGRVDLDRSLATLRAYGWAWWMFSSKARDELIWKAIVENEFGPIVARVDQQRSEHKRLGLSAPPYTNEVLAWQSINEQVDRRRCRMLLKWFDAERVSIGNDSLAREYRRFLSKFAQRND